MKLRWCDFCLCVAGSRSAVRFIVARMLDLFESQSTGRSVSMTEIVEVGVLTRLFRRDVIDEVLNETGRQEIRRRLLPARLVVYYVLCLALFYGDAYEEVMRRLVGSFGRLRQWNDGWVVPSSGAISQARKRLGEQPLKELFSRVALPLARPGTQGCWYRDWRVMAIDGVVLDAPDTPENAEEFGRGGNHLADSPFPQIRVVGLAECGTHAIVGAAMDGYHTYERALAVQLFPVIESNMIVLCDRGFFSYEHWRDACTTGAAMLWRVSSGLDLPVHHIHPDGSYRSQLAPRQMKIAYKQGKRRNIPEDLIIPVRVIEYAIPNRTGKEETYRLITSLLDHTEAPAQELAELYQQRWEFEIGLDEIETHQMGRPRVLRSKLPDLVRQEIWAFLLTHYAIRAFIHDAADDIGEDPDRISFIRTLRIIRRNITAQADFPPSPDE